jgi:glycosyltransferase involved in cell wall biosynthesis
MNVMYITAKAPYGSGETFLLTEMHAMLQAGAFLTIIPRNPPKQVFHDAAKGLLEKTVWLPLINPGILSAFFQVCLRNKTVWKIVRSIFRHSRTLNISIKNLSVLPKAVYIYHKFKTEQFEHIHAHWGSTTATMAWAISELTGIPWSMTLHRWDIDENNMLQWKVERASFVRCISENGKQKLFQILGGRHREKIKVLHMGVRIPQRAPVQRDRSKTFTIACPANLLPKKGHQYLVEACAIVREKSGGAFQCLIIGDGPLEGEIRHQVAQNNLQDVVKLAGRLPHNEIMSMYEKGQIHAVVLPSIVTGEGEKEGIPVALMEAMAYGIPVISTHTGGISELLSGGAGLLVKEKDAAALADAIMVLKTDVERYQELCVKGYEKICSDFDVGTVVQRLLSNIGRNSKL